jgi:hypothetical protein
MGPPSVWREARSSSVAEAVLAVADLAYLSLVVLLARKFFVWTEQSNPTGIKKNTAKQMVKTARMSFTMSTLHRPPQQSSSKGHASTSSTCLFSHFYPNAIQHEIIMKMSVNTMEVMNVMNQLWLLAPTQLLIQGQWWSKRSTHLLHIAQCFDLAERNTSQSGHISQG